MMELIIPTMEFKQAAWDYRQEHIDCGETHIHGSSSLTKADNYENWLERITWNQTNSTPDLVTGNVYFACVDCKIVGTIAVRHKLNDALLKSGGHIGYGIRPSERRKGYGAKMLALALEKCRGFGIDKALITCDKDNIASAKTAARNGGVLENEITEENGNIVERYWITINKAEEKIMDLHDYADVAQNYDHYLPETVNDAYFKGFEEFHLSLAEKYGKGGVLDIACGTGALTIPLVKAGYDVTALDLSAPMVEVTREKLRSENLNADLLAANMTDFQIPRKFSLAIIARSGFMHLLTAKEQRQTLMTIREHLADGGVLTFNHFQPFPIIQAEQMKAAPDEYFLRSEYTNHEGKRERIYNAVTYDHITQVQTGSWKFETLDDDGNATDTRVRPWAMRHTCRQEMEYLFELCGYGILGVYDNYCYDEARGMFVWVVKKQ